MTSPSHPAGGFSSRPDASSHPATADFPTAGGQAGGETSPGSPGGQAGGTADAAAASPGVVGAGGSAGPVGVKLPNSGPSPTTSRSVPDQQSLNKVVWRLHLRLWKKSWTHNAKQQWALTILLGIYAFFGIIGAASIYLIVGNETGKYTALADGAGEVDYLSAPLANHPWTVFGSLGALGLIIITLMWPSGENQVTASKLAMYPIKAESLTRALVPTVFAQSRNIIATIITIITIVLAIIVGVITGQVLVIPVAIIGLILGLVTLVLFCQTILVVSGTGGSRNKQEKIALYGSMVFLLLIGVFNVIMNMSDSMMDNKAITILVLVCGWTPFASGPALIEDAATGSWLLLLLRLAITFVFIWLMFRAWTWALRRDMESAADESGGDGEVKARSSFFLPFTPHTVAGAIYSRQLKYWTRDIRFKYSLIFIPPMIILFLLIGAFTHNTSLMITAGVLALVSTTSFISNDFGYDGPSNWMHMVANVRGKDIVRARIGVSLTFAAPNVALFLVFFLIFSDHGTLGLSLLGTSIGIVFTGAALGLFFSTYNPFPTGKPGVNPMKDSSSQSSAAFLSVFASAFLVAIPACISVLIPSSGELGWWFSFAFSIPLGLIVLAVLSRVCARRIDDKYPEIFAKVRHYR